MQLTSLDFIVITIYMMGIVVIGLLFSGKQSDKATYFLGNRKMHWFIAGISVIATLLSSISFLGVPGEMIRHGIGYFSLLLAFVLIIPIVNYLVIPYLMELKAASIYEFLEMRFGLTTRMVAASTFTVSCIIWCGTIVYTTSFAISTMTGWSIPYLIIVIGTVTTFYTTIGGMRAVMWADFIQFTVLFGGAAFVLIYIGLNTNTSPFIWWNTFSEAGRTTVPIFSFDPTVRITLVASILSYLIWNICTHGADQVAAQRYLSTSSIKNARRAVWVFSVSTVAILLLLAFVGLALFYYFYIRSGVPVQTFQGQIALEADKVFPRFIAGHLPTGISGLIVAAILAAAMSSLSSAINSISTVLVTDFIERFQVYEKYRKLNFTAVIIGIFTGIIGIISALIFNRIMQSGEWNIMELVYRVNHIFVTPLGLLFIIGFIFPRVNSSAAIGGFAVGVAAAFCISFSKEMFNLEKSIAFVWSMPGAFISGILATLLLSQILRIQPKANC